MLSRSKHSMIKSEISVSDLSNLWNFRIWKILATPGGERCILEGWSWKSMLFKMTFLKKIISIIKLCNQIWQKFKYLMTSSKNTLKTPLRGPKFLGCWHFSLVPGLNYQKNSKLANPQNMQVEWPLLLDYNVAWEPNLTTIIFHSVT